MKIGDLVRDIDTGDLAVIIEIDPVWRDPESTGVEKWDYLVYHQEYGRFYLDRFEIEMIGKQ